MSLSQAKAAASASLADKKIARKPARTCGQLKAQEDAIRLKREKMEADNVKQRAAAEKKLAERKAKDIAKLEKEYEREAKALVVKYGCVPKVRKKSGKRSAKQKPQGAAEAGASAPAKPPGGRKRSGKRSSKSSAPKPDPDVAPPINPDPPQIAGAAFRASDQTVRDVLAQAYRRTWVFPWEDLPADAPWVVMVERSAWIDLLAGPALELDAEARYSLTGVHTAFGNITRNGAGGQALAEPAMRFLAFPDNARVNFTFNPDRKSHLMVVLAAKWAGYEVDPLLLAEADISSVLTALEREPHVKQNLQELRKVGTGPGLFIRGDA